MLCNKMRQMSLPVAQNNTLKNRMANSAMVDCRAV